VLRNEQKDAELYGDALAPEYYVNGPDGTFIAASRPDIAPAAARAQRREGIPRTYINPWYGSGSVFEGLAKRVGDSLKDAEAMNGYDSLTGQRYPEAGKDLRLAAVVAGAVDAHEELWRDWPELRDVVDPRLPVAVVNRLPHEADPIDVVHEAVVDDMIEYHTPVAFDPEHPSHLAERHGLVAGLPHKLFALRGAWRDYPLFARDLAPDGEHQHHVPQACAVKNVGCLRGSGGHFLMVHRARYLVVVPICSSCRGLVTDGIPPV